MNVRIAVAGISGVVGRYVDEEARRRHHEVVPVSRARGVDVASGAGLSPALTGVEAIVDVTNPGTTEEGPATEFFRRAARNLQRVGADQGVRHLITLSIVGIDDAPSGYLAAKLAHERASVDGPLPTTIQRATMFHEFPGQLLGWAGPGEPAAVFDVRVQTIAARTVAGILVDLAEGPPAGHVTDIAGPEPAGLVDLARAFARGRGLDVEIVADTETLAALPAGALLPAPGSQLAGPTFEAWLGGDDAAALGR